MSNQQAQKPSVGRIVHYVSHGTPIRPDGTQTFPPACRAALVTEVGDDGTTVGLCVTNPTGEFYHPLASGGCQHDPGERGPGDTPDTPDVSYQAGTWHWPERV